MNIFRTNPERVRQLETLKSYIDEWPDGESRGWLDIETATGIPMPSPKHREEEVDGRSLFRHACKLLRRHYSASPGNGVRMSAASTASDIVRLGWRGVDRRIRGTAKKAGDLLKRHTDLTPSEKSGLESSIAVAGVMQAQAKGAMVLKSAKLLRG